MIPGRLFHVLLSLMQLVTVVHKSILQLSNQLAALRPVLNIHNFMLSLVLPGLLLRRRLVPNFYPQNRWPQDHICFACWLHTVEELQSSWSWSQGQEFQMTVELAENHIELWSAAIALWNCVPWPACHQCSPNLVHTNGAKLHWHFCCRIPKSASWLL